ncbi:MAG: NAD kinase [Bacteroidetes bacterium]|nr:NAD kinase [Bacteroidota bacterium]
MRIAIYTRQHTPNVIEIVKGIIQECEKINIQPIINENVISDLTIETYNQDNFNADCLISIGGDGTLLDTVLYVKNKNIPVLGINTGRMGFLAIMSVDDISNIIRLIYKRSFTIEKRSLLYLESNMGLFGDKNIALNDFVVHKKDTSSMITVHTYLNGDYLNSYWADGLIISSPTGSTGYSLSCGGPIIFPTSNSFAITPISPHHLNVRPVIVPDTSVVSFEVDSRGSNFLISLDSRSMTVDSNIEIAVRKSDEYFQLINLNDKSYIETLRKKMGWGVDFRN